MCWHFYVDNKKKVFGVQPKYSVSSCVPVSVVHNIMQEISRGSIYFEEWLISVSEMHNELDNCVLGEFPFVNLYLCTFLNSNQLAPQTTQSP